MAAKVIILLPIITALAVQFRDPKEGRFGTAQALAKRLSLMTHRESS
jgi:hypothetical protein